LESTPAFAATNFERVKMYIGKTTIQSNRVPKNQTAGLVSAMPPRLCFPAFRF